MGQVTPQAIQGMEDAPAESGLQEAIQYMKQEVDDAQRIAQMMEVSAGACASAQCACELPLSPADDTRVETSTREGSAEV